MNRAHSTRSRRKPFLPGWLGGGSRRSRSRRAAPSARPLSQKLTLLAGGVLASAMMLLGGGPASSATLALFALLGVLLLAAMTASGAWREYAELPLLAQVGLAAIVLVPLLQMVPLPPDLWRGLPGQEVRAQVLGVVGLGGSWQPLTLTPVSTGAAAILAIVFVALVVAAISLDDATFRWAAWLVFGLVALGILVGVVQVATGGRIPRFYRSAHLGALIGFMANKNHMALLIAAAMPLLAFVLEDVRGRRSARFWIIMFIGFALVALVTANSRAGLALGAIVAVLTLLRYVSPKRPAVTIGLVLVAAVAAVVVATSSAFEALFSRFGAVADDLRWEFLQETFPLLDIYWRTGSGIGSFAELYAVHERLAVLRPFQVNQLHNDYVQLLLEAGVGGIAALLLFAAGCLNRGWRLWRLRSAEARRALLFGSAIVLIFALHSLVDYPLRRAATLPMLAIGVSLLLRVPHVDRLPGRARGGE